MEGGKEANYWPGFVDALSNVVLTLVFVLVIFVFALVTASQNISKKVAEATKAEQAHTKAQVELSKALAELEKLRAAEEQSETKVGANGAPQTCLRFSKSDDTQKAEVDQNSLVIMFGANAISVTEDTTKMIHDFIESYRARTHDMNAKFIIESSDNPDSSSPLMARETQLGRMLNVRNALLSGKVESNTISVRTIAPQKQKDSYDWIKIYVGK